MCIEFKRAHATDLVHGLKVQLVEYMRRKQTDFGIYVVLDFGPGYPQTDHFTLPDGKPLGSGLNHQLSLISGLMRPFSIRTLVFELIDKPSPSKM